MSGRADYKIQYKSVCNSFVIGFSSFLEKAYIGEPSKS